MSLTKKSVLQPWLWQDYDSSRGNIMVPPTKGFRRCMAAGDSFATFPPGWSKRGELPFKVVDLMQAALYSPKYEHIIIDTAARPDKEELEALADGCNLLVLPTTPDALAIDALLQTVDLLQSLESDKPEGHLRSNRYRVLLTMIHPKPVKMAEQAREALSELPLFKRDIRRLICHEKASLQGVPVYEVKSDRYAPAL